MTLNPNKAGFVKDGAIAHRNVTVRASRLARVCPEVLFSLLDAPRGWPLWTVIGSVAFDQPDDEMMQDVGARRTFTTGVLHLYEEVVVRQPDRRIDYALLKGLPLDNYVGRIELSPIATYTRLDWSATFRPRSLALWWFWRAAIWLILDRLSRDVVRAAEAGVVPTIRARVEVES